MRSANVYELNREESKNVLKMPSVSQEFLEQCEKVAEKYRAAKRDPDRLCSFYNKLMEIHATYFPDLRFGQLFSNFSSWLATKKRIDIFFPEEYKMLDYIQEYADEICKNQG